MTLQESFLIQQSQRIINVLIVYSNEDFAIDTHNLDPEEWTYKFSSKLFE